MAPKVYMHVFPVSVYSPLYLTTNTMKSRLFSDACVKYEHAWSLQTLFFTHHDFCAFPMDKCNATVKTISSKIEAISWLPLPWR